MSGIGRRSSGRQKSRGQRNSLKKGSRNSRQRSKTSSKRSSKCKSFVLIAQVHVITLL